MSEIIIKERNFDGKIVERLPRGILDEYNRQDEIIDDLKNRLYEIGKLAYKSHTMKDIIKLIPEDILDEIDDEIQTEMDAYYTLTAPSEEDKQYYW